MGQHSFWVKIFYSSNLDGFGKMGLAMGPNLSLERPMSPLCTFRHKPSVKVPCCVHKLIMKLVVFTEIFVISHIVSLKLINCEE